MSLSILLRPEAEEDVAKIYQWYESQHAGLGDEFVGILQQKLEIAREHPEAFQIVYKNIRRIILAKFPYLVFYIPTETKVVVLAVLHAFRDPVHWPRH